jgi:hypothetical protein
MPFLWGGWVIEDLGYLFTQGCRGHAEACLDH